MLVASRQLSTFFSTRHKTKKFPRHVFQSMEIENYGA
ncbi:MAG: DUF1661 domain-containing protein [Porphyromonas gingivalis]